VNRQQVRAGGRVAAVEQLLQFANILGRLVHRASVYSAPYMERVLGIGGTFLKAKDSHALAEWYRANLGVPVDEGQTYATLSAADGDQTVWATFESDTTYFGSADSQFMFNYRVANLDAMLQQLRDAGTVVDDNVETHDHGKFGWATDPEGNRFELWEPIGDL
jgi:predicted enzyme related to lactoylglutathione lyase